jgi:hypothetical protein
LGFKVSGHFDERPAQFLGFTLGQFNGITAFCDRLEMDRRVLFNPQAYLTVRKFFPFDLAIRYSSNATSRWPS